MGTLPIPSLITATHFLSLAGKYYIGDPAYVMKESVLKDLWGNSAGEDVAGANRAPWAYARTAHGDGT